MGIKKNAADRSLLSNIGFVLSLMVQYKKSSIIYTAVNMLCKTLSAYLIILSPKLIADELLSETINMVHIVEILAVTGGLSFLLQNVAFWAGHRFAADVIWFKTIIKAGNKFMSMDYPKTENPEILSLCTRTEEVLKNAGEGIYGMLNLLFELCSLTMSFLLSFYLISTLNLGLSILFIGAILINFLLVEHGSRDKYRNTEKTTLERRMLHYIHDFMFQHTSGKDLRLFHMGRYLQQKYDQNISQVIDTEKQNSHIEFRCNLVTCVSTAVQEIGLFFYLIREVLFFNMSIGNFIFYFGAAKSFCGSFQEVVRDVAKLRTLSLGITTIRNFLDMESETADGIEDIPVDGGKIEIVFDNVSYRYPGQAHDTISDLSFSIKSGERLALVGMNGAGKTTLVKLMMRMYDPTKGTIMVNGTDVKKISVEKYYKLFSPVFQNTELYAMSLAENISMRPLQSTDMVWVESALEKAHLTSVVDRLPNGVRTSVLKVIDADGVEFSGGEEQRIAIARAAYKDAPCLILDEPTAALDPLAELALYQDFNELAADKLTVFISHRLASVSFCDRILLLDKGKMLEYGTHEQLIKQKGEYYSMFEAQAKFYRQEGGGS